ncbi:BTAD domain-containing putative transcriptional regulator [Actinoplanes sp. NPDC049681]|uniref:BTAD domain-containing putative transcriptional regulator n=1 Tax=Actinoplanes sp. NPDC049681 TaxID=3363905 RepID=UPI00378882C8
MRVCVLGQMTVTDGDGVILPAGELPRRARQVLAVLAARHDRIQSKDALADAVWGTKLPGNHVAALEHYVSVIRRRLQPSGNAGSWFIVTRNSGYLFDTSRAALDLAELRAAIRSLDELPPDGQERLAAHAGILTLARQLPFPEDPYADWAEAARSEVQFAAVNSLLELAKAALANDPARSLRLALDAIEMSPYLESGYEAAMAAAVAMERPDEALRIFDRCRRVLDEELGVPPSPGLVRLQRAVLAERHAVTAAAEPAPEPDPRPAKRAPALRSVPAPVTQERFLGRTTQLSVLFGPDAPRMVHVVGPVGSGKSAFLAEVARHAPGRTGVGHGGASAGVLRLAWLRAALLDLGADPDVLAVVDAAADRPLRRDELELIGTVLAGPEPAYLAVDDAADLDQVSVAELAWLNRHCPTLRIVLTYCYPSQIVGRPLATLNTPVVLRLSALTADELKPLGDPGLAERSGGIPALVAVDSQPAEITHAVAMQIARQRTRWMPELAWEVLRSCAVLGPLSTADLAPITGRTVPELLSCIDSLVHANLLSEGPEGEVRHRSSVIRDAIAEQVSSASSAHLRKQLAAAS